MTNRNSFGLRIRDRRASRASPRGKAQSAAFAISPNAGFCPVPVRASGEKNVDDGPVSLEVRGKLGHSRAPMTRPTPARQILTGIFLILGAGFLFTVMDATAKYLAQSYSVIEVAWGRYLFATLSLPLILHRF